MREVPFNTNGRRRTGSGAQPVPADDPGAGDLRVRSGPAGCVVWVVAQGLGADHLDFYAGSPGGAAAEAVNLKAMAEIGTSVLACPGMEPRSPTDTLTFLLSGGRVPTWPGDAEEVRRRASSHWLPQRAGERGKLWVSMLPHRDVLWPARVADRSPHCDLLVDVPPGAPAGPAWSDLLAARPRVMVRNTGDDEEIASFMIDRILARFPGNMTQARRAGLGGEGAENAVEPWLEWVGDAFLRCIWFALGRPAGVAAVLYHPAPEVYGRTGGGAGYRRGIEVLDQLVGRLLLLREHEQAGDMALLVSGDYVLPDLDASGDNRIPVLAVGPGLDAGAVVESCTLQDLTGLFASYL